MSVRRNYKKCVICGKEFYAPPSSKKITCSKECSAINKSRTHIGKSNQWNPVSRQKLSERGKTSNLQLGTIAAKKSQKSGRFETNINAKDWHLISPEGKHYYFHSLNHWMRDNCVELFSFEPDSKAYANALTGLCGAKRAVLGKNYNTCTYKGWQVIPTKDDYEVRN